MVSGLLLGNGPLRVALERRSANRLSGWRSMPAAPGR